MPKSDVNREYYQQNNEVALSKTGGASKFALFTEAVYGDKLAQSVSFDAARNDILPAKPVDYHQQRYFI